MKYIFLAGFILLFHISALGQIGVCEQSLKEQREYLEKLLVKYSDEYWEVKEVKAKISSLEKQCERLRQFRLKTTAVELNSKDKDLLLNIYAVELQIKRCVLVSAPECSTNPAAKLADLYAEAVKRPPVIEILIGNIFAEYSRLRETAKSAPQVSQSADEASIQIQLLILAQNQRIIELLEQIAKKKL